MPPQLPGTAHPPKGLPLWCSRCRPPQTPAPQSSTGLPGGCLLGTFSSLSGSHRSLKALSPLQHFQGVALFSPTSLLPRAYWIGERVFLVPLLLPDNRCSSLTPCSDSSTMRLLISPLISPPSCNRLLPAYLLHALKSHSLT